MKKRDSGKSGPKEFKTNLFRNLKGVKTVKAEPVAPPPPKPEPAPQADDTDLFLRAMEDVARLDRRKEAPRGGLQASHQPRKLDEEERKVFLQALEKLELDVTFSDEIQEELPRPLPVNRMRQLRRGTIRIDYELDLHGLTRDEALANLARFVRGAHARGQKAVLVITGKGNNSEGEPVLQGAVDGWLRNQGKEMVAEFFPAPREMGGGGAVVVFLRGK